MWEGSQRGHRGRTAFHYRSSADPRKQEPMVVLGSRATAAAYMHQASGCDAESDVIVAIPDLLHRRPAAQEAQVVWVRASCQELAACRLFSPASDGRHHAPRLGNTP